MKLKDNVRLTYDARIEELMEKPGRNSPCPCGSNRKYKQCCLGREAEMAARCHEAALAQLAQGRPEAAVPALRQVLALDGKMVRAHNNLGIALGQVGRLDEAEAAYRDALRLDGKYTPAHHNLGDLLQRRGRLPEARRCFECALQIDPALNRSRINLGNILLRSGQYVAAVENGREALRLEPGSVEALMVYAGGLAATGDIPAALELMPESGASDVPTYQRCALLGARFMNSGLLEPARRCLEAALREEPGDVMTGHLRAALRGDNPEQASDGYVRQLFDAGAATFDSDLVSKLGYAIPREMVEALGAVDGAPAQPWSVLDLGCGTGLVGMEIARLSRSLVGLDISPKMIECARNRNIYTDLHCADLIKGLRSDPIHDTRYDVVTAADVFVYVGKLDAVIPGIRGVMNIGGLLAFSVEAIQDCAEGYRLGIWGRYAHSADYLQRLAIQHGFDVVLFRKTRIRFESGAPVEGWLTLWQAR